MSSECWLLLFLKHKRAYHLNTRLLNLSVSSECGLLLFLKHNTNARTTVTTTLRLNRGISVPYLTRAERTSYCTRLQEAALASRLCEGLEDTTPLHVSSLGNEDPATFLSVSPGPFLHASPLPRLPRALLPETKSV